MQLIIIIIKKPEQSSVSSRKRPRDQSPPAARGPAPTHFSPSAGPTRPTASAMRPPYRGNTPRFQNWATGRGSPYPPFMRLPNAGRGRGNSGGRYFDWWARPYNATLLVILCFFLYIACRPLKKIVKKTLGFCDTCLMIAENKRRRS